jgi:hypothetical protein
MNSPLAKATQIAQIGDKTWQTIKNMKQSANIKIGGLIND